MGAINDRLILTLQDAKDWLLITSAYVEAIVEVLASPPASTAFFVLLDGSRIEVDSGLTPTPASVAALLVSAIDALPTWTATDQGAGKYKIVKTAGGTFELWISTGQDLIPTLPDDAVLSALITSAKLLADEYCNNEFATLDSDGEVVAGTEEDIPAPVKTGVLQLLGWLLAEQRAGAIGAGTGGTTGVTGPIKSKKTGDVSISYGSSSDVSTGGGSFRSAASKVVGLPIVVTSILDLFRLMPGYRVARTKRLRPLGLGDMGPSPVIIDPATLDEDDL